MIAGFLHASDATLARRGNLLIYSLITFASCSRGEIQPFISLSEFRRPDGPIQRVSNHRALTGLL